MLSILYRGVAGAAPSPRAQRQISRGQAADLAAESDFGGSVPTPESFDDFQQAFEDLVPVYRCADMNARAVASAKLRLYRDVGGDQGEEITDPLDPILAFFRRPNPRTSGRRWVYQTQLSKELIGNTYDEIVRVRPKGQALQLWTLNGSKMAIDADEAGIGLYRYKPGNKEVPFSPDDIWHDRFENPNSEVYGLPPLRAARRHVEADKQLEQAMLALLKNGLRVSGVLHMDSDVSPGQIDSLRAQLRELHAGVRNWFKALVVGGGRKFEQLTMTMAEFGANDLRAWNTGMILKAYGVYPIIFGDIDKSATRENATTQALLYYWHTIQPRAADLEDEITTRLIPMLKIKGSDRVYAKLDFSETPIMKQLALDEALAKQVLIESTVLNPNEVRSTLGYEPRAGGDAFWSQKQLAPMSQPNGPDGEPGPQKMLAILNEAKRIASAVSELQDIREAA